MKTTYFFALAMLVGVAGCGDKTDTKSSSGDTKPSTTATSTSTAAQATATATATATAVAVQTASAEESAETVSDPSADLDDSAFASVEVPASVSVPTEEDYEGAAESAITTANADTELKKLEKELDAGAP